MKRQRYGRIVLTTSGRAMHLDGAAPGLIAYSVGKMAQLGLMTALAVEVDEAGIRINAISPVAATRVLRRHAPELLPELVAPGVVFLASSRCDFSGAVLRAEGGRFSTARWHFSSGLDLGAGSGRSRDNCRAVAGDLKPGGSAGRARARHTLSVNAAVSTNRSPS